MAIGSRHTVPVLMAEKFSPGARQLLRDERIGYFDASGSLFIPASRLYVRVDRPASRNQVRSLNNLFADRCAQPRQLFRDARDRCREAEHDLGRRPEGAMAAGLRPRSPGLPGSLPFAFAAAISAFVRSEINARSSRATAPSTWRKNMPCGVEVSMGSRRSRARSGRLREAPEPCR